MRKAERLIISVFVLSALVVGFQMPAHAAKATFRATVSPLALQVTPDGGIIGNKNTTVRMTRSKEGAKKPCTEIYWLDVVRGGNYASPSLNSLALGRKGECTFYRELLVQPFSDQEILNVCRGVSGQSQSLAAIGLANAWKHLSDYGGTDYSLAGVKSDRRPMNMAQLRFSANVQCATAPPLDQGPGKEPIPKAFNMQGWWRLTTGIAARDGAWNFVKTQLTPSQGKFSTSGPSTMRNGQLIQGRGRGNAILNANQQFSWSFSDRVSCSGKINNANSIVAGTCKGAGSQAPSYSFKLEKVNGPVDTGIQSPVPNPRTIPSGVTPKPAPAKPGNTFTPQPPLPPKPRW